MEIIVHFPEDERALNVLRERIGVQHGEFVYSYLGRLDLSAEQKTAVIEDIGRMISRL